MRHVAGFAGGRPRFWFAAAADIAPGHVFGAQIWRIASREGVYTLLDEAVDRSAEDRCGGQGLPWHQGEVSVQGNPVSAQAPWADVGQHK